jgi:hypothetical protein
VGKREREKRGEREQGGKKEREGEKERAKAGKSTVASPVIH